MVVVQSKLNEHQRKSIQTCDQRVNTMLKATQVAMSAFEVVKGNFRYHVLRTTRGEENQLVDVLKTPWGNKSIIWAAKCEEMGRPSGLDLFVDCGFC